MTHNCPPSAGNDHGHVDVATVTVRGVLT
jgi:hypothetical protein